MSIHSFKSLETTPPANTNTGFPILKTIPEDDEIDYVSGNMFVPSTSSISNNNIIYFPTHNILPNTTVKLEYESFEDKEEWEESRSTVLLRQMNIGWYEDDDAGGEATMAARYHDTDHTASGETTTAK